MSNRFIENKRADRVGLPPGELVKQSGQVVHSKIKVINYCEKDFLEKELNSIEETFEYFQKENTVTWLLVDNVKDYETLQSIGQNYGIHPLVLEDIQNADHRAKLEIFDDYIFIILKVLKPASHTSDNLSDQDNLILSQQISLIMGTNYVICFTENLTNLFESVKERIRISNGRIRRMGSDYLTYALVDTVVDNYFVVIEKFGEILEDLEESVSQDPDEKTLQKIHNLKREMIFSRKSVWPIREVVAGLQKADSALIKESTQIFLRDVYDHTIQIMDTMDSYRDMLAGILDIYLSSTSNKMNSVMKVLTVITTIFIPLTFIAGVYGMNFKHMPELEWEWGYEIIWGINILLAVLMVYIFKKKKWL